MKKKALLSGAILTAIGLITIAGTRQNSHKHQPCKTEPPTPCYPNNCTTCLRCLGPENFAGNPPVCPKTCDGDFIAIATVNYWKAEQEGLEFAIDNWVTNPNAGVQSGAAPTSNSILQLNQLVNAEYQHPRAKWRWGTKFGLKYCSPCDGWDASLIWTWLDGKSKKLAKESLESNRTLLPLWSQFTSALGLFPYATAAENRWRMKLNLIDFEIGRHYWTSRYLSVRPFISLRYASIKQHDAIEYRGGSWSAITGDFSQPALRSLINLLNFYRGIGLRAGLDSTWNIGCGFAFYGISAVSTIYGRFHVKHAEHLQVATVPHTLINILDSEQSLKASRPIFDLVLGIQYSTLFCRCRYGLTAMLGWEQHIFFNQNQLWKVTRFNATSNTITVNPISLNLTGQNQFQQRRGSLTTQGWTLAFRFDF